MEQIDKALDASLRECDISQNKSKAAAIAKAYGVGATGAINGLGNSDNVGLVVSAR